MISYPIKTWRCNCGYAQDFEPTQENHNIHFNEDRNYLLNDIDENECPSCALKGVRGSIISRETNTYKKSVHNHLEQVDIDRHIQELIDEPVRRITTGRKLMVAVNYHTLGKDINAFEHIDEERDETEEEKITRIEKAQENMVPADPDVIQSMREIYECLEGPRVKEKCEVPSGRKIILRKPKK